MTTDLSAAALLSAAEAFLARGDAIQYDQRSMDRVVQITPCLLYTSDAADE